MTRNARKRSVINACTLSISVEMQMGYFKTVWMIPEHEVIHGCTLCQVEGIAFVGCLMGLFIVAASWCPHANHQVIPLWTGGFHANPIWLVLGENDMVAINVNTCSVEMRDPETAIFSSFWFQIPKINLHRRPITHLDYCMAEGGVFIGRVLEFWVQKQICSVLPEATLHCCFWGEWPFIELLAEACDLGSMTL